MELTPVEWHKIFHDESADKAAVIVTAQWAQFLRDMNIDEAFEQYGVVESTRYERHYGYHYLIIEFKDISSATNLISRGAIVLRNVDFIVKPFHSIVDLIASLRHTNMAHSSSYHRVSENRDTNILQILNDDCLSEIFGKIHSLSDVVAIGNVCTRFRRIAQKAFIPLLKRKQIDFMELTAGGNVITLIEIETFLRRHGPAIVSVQLCEESYRYSLPDVVNPILKLLQRHCSNLKSLTLYKEASFNELDDRTLIFVRSLISKLSHVEIWNQCRYRTIPFGRYIEFIAACTNVETLIVNIESRDMILPDIHYPKLKVFQTHWIYTKLDQFLARNRQIETLNVPWAEDRVRVISENMHEIREIFIHGLPRGFNHLDCVRLNSLKQANISMRWSDLSSSVRVIFDLSNITSFQFDIMATPYYDILVELVKRLRNLQNLELYSTWTRNWEHIPKKMPMEVLQHASKLTKLKVRWPDNFTDDYNERDYDELLQIIQIRSAPLKLNFVLDTITYHCDGDHGIKTIHRNIDPQWLTVTKRYLYLTRRAGCAYDNFQRQIEKYVQRTHVRLSSLPTYDSIPSKEQKIKFNVL